MLYFYDHNSVLECMAGDDPAMSLCSGLRAWRGMQKLKAEVVASWLPVLFLNHSPSGLLYIQVLY